MCLQAPALYRAPVPPHLFVQGLSPSPLPQTSLNLFNLDLTVQGFPRYEHYVAYTVAMRAVGIQLKFLLVLFSFSFARTIAMASSTPSQGKICDMCAEAFKKNQCLLTVTETGHNECLETLLKTGADVNFGCRSLPPIKFLRHSQCRCDKMSIPTGTDGNTEYDHNYTPLMHAARHDQSECTKIVVQAGADVNKQNHNGDTALIDASCSNSVQCM